MKNDVQSKIVVYRTVVRPPAQIIRTVVGYYRCRKTDDQLPTKNTVVASYERTVNNDMNSGCLCRAYRGFQCTHVGRRGSMHRISLWNSQTDFHGEIPWGYLQEPARTNCLPYSSQYLRRAVYHDIFRWPFHFYKTIVVIVVYWTSSVFTADTSHRLYVLFFIFFCIIYELVMCIVFWISCIVYVRGSAF